MVETLQNLNGISEKDLSRIYQKLYLIRRSEERIADLYPSDVIKSPVHLSIGQEAISVGVCDVLKSSDVVSGTYRGHALYLAKGGELTSMLAEMFGKSDGSAAGKGGSMHLVDMSKNILGGSAVVGTNIPLAVGFALKLKAEGKGRVVVCFFGDGATEEGAFYESLNFAALRELPILFVCENNSLAIHTPIEKRWASRDLCKRVQSFGVPSHQIDDMEVFRIRERARGCIDSTRKGGGPEFLECLTYRWLEHVGPNSDFDAGYRSHEDAQQWIDNDQVQRVANLVDSKDRQSIENEVNAYIETSITFAESSPFHKLDELRTHVYAD